MNDPFDQRNIVALTARVAKLERAIAFLLKQLNLQYVDEPPAAEFPEVTALLSQGKKIQAIQVYREKTGAGLAEAKTFVEALEKNLLGG